MAGSQKFSSSSSTSVVVISASSIVSDAVVAPMAPMHSLHVSLGSVVAVGGTTLVTGSCRPPRAGSPTVATYLAEQLRMHDDRRSPQTRDRSRSPLNLTVSPSSRRSTAASSPTAPSPVCSETSVTSNPIKSRLQDFFNVSETSVGVVEDKTRGLCHFYLGLTSTDKMHFLRTLAVDYGIDRRVVQQLSSLVTNTLAMRRGPSSTELASVRTMERLRVALLPRYQSLFTHISRLDNGVKFLANLRADVIGALRCPSVDQECPHLMTMNSTLHQLLSVWLALGGLQLERITWQTPCDLLQKISAYEAVQPIRNLTELRRRVGPYKRCFCFTHSAMPREPLIVVHTALTQSISHTIQSIVGGASARGPPGVDNDSSTNDDSQTGIEDIKLVNAAVFYSITSTQRGLQGVELGGQVIKSVMLDLVNEFPRLHQFASLSPVPGFRDWLLEEINSYVRLRDLAEEPAQTILTSYELAEMSALFNVSEAVVFSVLRGILVGDDWIEQPHIVGVLQTPLLRLCARYLYVEKKRGYAINPVANFHLHNGAVLWRLNWLADTSPRGVAVSCTIMANYRYYLDETDSNRRKYVESQILTASDQVLDLLRQQPPSIAPPQPTCRLPRDSAPISNGR